MSKELNKRAVNLIREANIPFPEELEETPVENIIEDVIGKKFSFRFDDPRYQSITFYGIIGSIQIWLWKGNGKGGSDRIVITPTAPFSALNLGLFNGLYYCTKDKCWRTISLDLDERFRREGKIYF